jgi:phosphatidylserine decarboxylase
LRIDPAGWPFVAGLVVLGAAAAWWSPWLAAIPLVLLVFTLNFFRDPERSVPDDPSLVLAPACGRIIRADAARVSIFMNVFDVHVCRSPVAGRVVSVEHARGSFVSAYRDAASEHNERVVVVVAPPSGRPVRVTLVAGLIARRIVCRVEPGKSLTAGERIGIIRFGSRVDVDLPEGAGVAVGLRDRVVSGETTLARRAAASL